MLMNEISYFDVVCQIKGSGEDGGDSCTESSDGEGRKYKIMSHLQSEMVMKGWR